MIKRHLHLIILTVILFLNITFAKYIVHQFYNQNYVHTLLFVGLNILLFPIAFFIYKRGKKKENVNKYES